MYDAGLQGKLRKPGTANE